jgi:hypothetical protein
MCTLGATYYPSEPHSTKPRCDITFIQQKAHWMVIFSQILNIWNVIQIYGGVYCRSWHYILFNSHLFHIPIVFIFCYQNHIICNSYVGFEVFTAVVMNSIIFWDMTPCSPLSFNRRFGGTYLLKLQGRRNRFSKPASKQVASSGVDMFLRNVGWNSTDYTASYPRRWYSL